jgi:hypothetical protein
MYCLACLFELVAVKLEAASAGCPWSWRGANEAGRQPESHCRGLSSVLAGRQ